jgi:type IV secretory pathway TrbF-like protein
MDPATNGAGLPLDWQGVSTDTIARMELAYQEIQRRDSQAERRAASKDTLAMRLALVIVALVGVLVYLALDRAQVRAFVQTVQVTPEGSLVQVGVPQSLYAYTPPEGVYLDMLSQWVRWVRWRGEDAPMLHAQRAWVYRHTCGVASTWLKAADAKDQPLKPGAKRVAVEVKSVTRIAAPQGYQVLWEETTTEKNNPTAKTQLWSGTFTVGRVALTTMDELLENRLGLCISAYELSPHP